MIFAFGTGANLIADMITSRDWMHDFGNTVFQMGYVIVILLMSLLLYPVRRVLRHAARKDVSEGKPKLSARTLAIFWSLLMFLGFGFIVADRPFIDIQNMSSGWQGLQAVLESSPIVLFTVSAQIFLVCLSAHVGISDWLGWILLLSIYAPRIFAPFNEAGKSHNLELFILGVALQFSPLRGRKTIANVFSHYWPLYFGALLILGMPTLTGRCDINPLQTYWERFRFYAVEAALVSAFLCGCFACGDPARISGNLGWWALFAYCTHVAWDRLLPRPYGAVFTYSCIVLFLLPRCLNRQNDDKSAKEKEGAGD